jgi:hypothetical protein
MAKRTIVRRPAAKQPARRKVSRKNVEDPVVNNWQGMFAVTEHWQSDLSFFADEVAFFRKLLDKYFIWLIDEKNRTDTQRVISDLATFEKERSSREHDVNLHRSQLTNLIQSPFAHDGQESIEKHATLETQMADFTKKFRSLKKEVFVFTEKIMDSEKLQHLLSNP